MRRRGHGRVPLVRRPRPRRGLAGAAAHAAADALPADVRHPGRRHVLRGGAHAAERPADRDREVGGAAGAARVRVLGDPAGRRRSRSWSPRARRPSTSCTSRRRTPPDSAQDFTSLNFCTREEKNAIAEAIDGFRFTQPATARTCASGCKQGIGLHHAGLLPKYRVLVEQLAQRGLLKVICGTDTLGVGINVPIRTVLFTRLCKFDGQKTARPLRARLPPDRRARRAARASTTAATWWRRPPSTSSRTCKLDEKAKDGKKVVKRKPPEHNFANWDQKTFKRLMGAPPERLTSRFEVSHGMLLNVLSPPRRRLPRHAGSSSATATRPTARRRRTSSAPGSSSARWSTAASSRSSRARADGSQLRVNVDLQEDFSMDHALSLYLLETIPLLDPSRADLRARPADARRDHPREPGAHPAPAARQAEGPEGRGDEGGRASTTTSAWRSSRSSSTRSRCATSSTTPSTRSPTATPGWARRTSGPKSIAREMFEGFRSFSDYIQEYDLERAEGLLLRHLNSVYKVLSQTVPDGARPTPCSRWSSTCATCCGRWTRACSTSGSGCATRRTCRWPGAAAPACAARAPGRALRRHARNQGLHRRHPHPPLRVPARVVDRRRRGACWPPSTHPTDGEQRSSRGRRRGCARPARPTAPSTALSASTPRRATCATHTSSPGRTTASGASQQMLVDPER